ncbi:BgTH12-07326 [Blumeria graminis f. sp. triticale]|uniref:BgTH12-07326 n=1 Tax=Blumeria graminis f. sp. triticale TaxID=1689686 RepID=A0A9W4DEM4_BLUGR|nr:BgTH12-07326 [Blumeria graminis f. sp. triticale]
MVYHCTIQPRGTEYLRFKAPKSWNVRAPNATLIDKVRALTSDNRSKHERDIVESEIHMGIDVVVASGRGGANIN